MNDAWTAFLRNRFGIMAMDPEVMALPARGVVALRAKVGATPDGWAIGCEIPIDTTAEKIHRLFESMLGPKIDANPALSAMGK